MKRLSLSFVICLFASVHLYAQKAVQLEGQVVCCESCWTEADRTRVEFGTAQDLLKAQSCVAEGDPTLIAVREGDKFTLYELEPGKYRLPGKNWLEFIGKRIRVNGEIRKRRDRSVVRVDSLEVLAPSLAEQDAANIVGKAVELTLKDPFGTQQQLSALKGRIVILNFWATYCVPCRKEMPDLAAIQNEYAALGLQVIGASADEPEDKNKVMQFVKETKVNFPIWLGASTADMMRFGLGTALPGTVIIGRDGRVAKVISGVINVAEVKKEIDALVASGNAEALAKNRTAIAKAKVSSVPS